MERFTVDGVVVKSSVTGEADVIVWILTRDRGVIRAFVKGARSTKSRLHGAISQFSYGSFTFFENKDVYTVSDAAVSDSFYELRTDLVGLTLAQYFCEVILKCVVENNSEDELLRLFLNCIYFLCGNKKPYAQIKSVFELRFACIGGYAPMLVGCDECGEYETEQMYFDCTSGKLLCGECGKNAAFPSVSAAGVSVMRHIVYSKFESVFSFSAEQSVLQNVSRLTQVYLQNCFRQSFRVLGYLTDIGFGASETQM